MDKKLRPMPTGISLVLGTLLTTNPVYAAVTDFDITGILTSPTGYIGSSGEQVERYIPLQQSANFTSFTYKHNDTDTPDNVPTPVPAPAAAWLFGSGLLGLLWIGRKRKNNRQD